MTGPEFLDLYRAALDSDAMPDWQKVWQAFAGMAWVVPLESQDDASIRPRMAELDDVSIVQAFPDMLSFADALTEPGHYAELDGAQLAALLAPAGVPLGLWLPGYSPIAVPEKTLEWIAATFRADVNRADSAGVRVTAPDLPAPEVVQALGQTVGAMGQDCAEAWLVTMTEPDRSPELVLVLGLSDEARAIEDQIAETITRALQAVSAVPLAVACPARSSTLMQTARRTGVGIGG